MYLTWQMSFQPPDAVPSASGTNVHRVSLLQTLNIWITRSLIWHNTTLRVTGQIVGWVCWGSNNMSVLLAGSCEAGVNIFERHFSIEKGNMWFAVWTSDKAQTLQLRKNYALCLSLLLWPQPQHICRKSCICTSVLPIRWPLREGALYRLQTETCPIIMIPSIMLDQ